MKGALAVPRRGIRTSQGALALRTRGDRWSVLAVLLAAGTARAEPLPPGSLEVFGGAVSGTGVDAKRLGFGYQLGASAAWQPVDTVKRWGFTVRWSVLFAGLYNGSAEQVNPPLRTVMMDLTAGIRFRPWSTPSRYLTARIGGGLFRSNDPIENGSRAYVGAVAAIGIDQYLGSILTGIDVRYGLIPLPAVDTGPSQVSVVLRFGLAGP